MNIKWYPGIILIGSVPSYAEVAAITPSPAMVFAKVIFVLGFIVALILFSAWFARRSGFANFINNENFKTIASLSLGQKEKAVLIKVGKQHLLLGVAPGGISNLFTFSDDEDPLCNPSDETSKQNDKQSRDFSLHIKKLLTQGQQK